MEILGNLHFLEELALIISFISIFVVVYGTFVATGAFINTIYSVSEYYGQIWEHTFSLPWNCLLLPIF